MPTWLRPYASHSTTRYKKQPQSVNMLVRQIRYGDCPEQLREEHRYGLVTDLEKASLREQQAVRAEAGLRTVSENQKAE